MNKSNQAKSSFQMERKKKLFMKCALNALRQYFNEKQIGFHPLIVCVSIKPGSEHRCSSLQSYPNKQVWKSLTELEKSVQDEISSYLIQKLSGLCEKTEDPILIEFQNRVQEGFKFDNFYKEVKNEAEIGVNKEQDTSENILKSDLEEHQERKKWKKGENFVSESRQIVQQIILCNKKGSLVSVSPTHYHKLRALSEKMINQKFEQSSEMKEFIKELQIFCGNTQDMDDQPRKKRKLIHQEEDPKPQNEVPQIKVEADVDETQKILADIIKQTHSIEPGIKLFLPNYQQIDKKLHPQIKQIEEEYYKNLYYMKVVGNELTRQMILLTWRTQFEPMVWKTTGVKEETHIPRTCQP